MGRTIGLALGGGGARGWSHIGVLRALEANDIPIHYIAGTSIGALVGAVYVRERLADLEQLADEMDTGMLISLLDVSFPGLGLVNGDKVCQFLMDYLVDTQIEDCFIPFQCVATNFLSKQEVIFSSGPLVNAVRASISIPGIFVPLKHEDTYLVDGGVVNPVPVSIAKNMGADIVIAVNLNRDPKTLERQHADFDDQEQRSSEAATPKAIARQHQDSAAAATTETAAAGAVNLSQPAEDEGFTQGLVDRYQNLKTILQDKIDDWMPDPETGMNIFDVIGNSINMMEQQVTHARLRVDVPDILIEPDLMDFGIFDFQQAKPLIQRGYDATIALMPELKARLSDSETPSA